MSARRMLIVLCIGIAAGLAPRAAVAGNVSIGSLLERPLAFDGQTVTVRGSASVVVENVAPNGARYVTFSIRDYRGARVAVVAAGRPDVGTADSVEVTGVFRHGPHGASAIEARSVRAQVRSLLF